MAYRPPRQFHHRYPPMAPPPQPYPPNQPFVRQPPFPPPPRFGYGLPPLPPPGPGGYNGPPPHLPPMAYPPPPHFHSRHSRPWKRPRNWTERGGRGRGQYHGSKRHHTEQPGNFGDNDPYYDMSMFEDPWKDLLEARGIAVDGGRHSRGQAGECEENGGKDSPANMAEKAADESGLDDKQPPRTDDAISADTSASTCTSTLHH